MGARRRAPLFIALGATFAGTVGVVSALTPELAGRVDLVNGILPPGVPDAARIVALAFGLALIWLARGLARGKSRAWTLAVGLVAASAAAHLAKGLDFEEATVSLVLLLALWRYRRDFAAPGDPAVVGPLVRVLLALAALGAFAALRSVDTLNISEHFESALALLAGLLAFRGLYLWLRPLAERGRHSARDARRAALLVREEGRDSLSYFALRQDKSYLFSASGNAFLAYRVVNGTLLVSGDPIGEPAEYEELMSEIRRIALARAWRVAVLGASGAQLPLYRRLGFKAAYLGDEAVMEPKSFSLEGRPIRKVRQSVTRLSNAGYSARAIRVSDADESLRSAVSSVSSEWRGRWPERGFTMAMDAVWRYPDSVLVVAEGPEGEIDGFIHLVPAPACGGWSLATMRRRRETPNGLMEFLIVETIQWARGESVSELSLNFSVFANVLRADRSAPLGSRVVRFLLLRFDRFFQLERLFSFNRKFFPGWRRRYVCFERYTDLPFVAFAYLHAEQLLTPPGPWARDDLAAV